jgi:modification methylase
MIEMWDELFINQNNLISKELNSHKGNNAFELMHIELDKIWEEVERVTIPGGWVAINIGDATRKR